MNQRQHWILRLQLKWLISLKELQQTGITQVIVTHEVNVAQKVATKVVYMELGKILKWAVQIALIIQNRTI